MKGLLIYVLMAWSGSAGILLVQHRANDSSANSAQVSISIATSLQGSLLVVGAMGGTNDSVAGVTDNASPPNAYALVPGSRGITSGGRWSEIWHALSGNPGATSVTITVRAVNTNRKVGEVWEVSGADLASPLDGNGVNGGTFSGSVETGPSIITTSPGEFVAALARSNNTTVSQNDAIFVLDDITGGANGASHAIPAAGTFAPRWNVQIASSPEFISSVAAFRVAGGPPPPPPSPPTPPSNPTPTNGATGVSVNAGLSWTASTNATSYDVYFGTSSIPPLTANVTGTTYYPSGLTASTNYFWMIVARGPGGTASSPNWSFTTAASPPPPPPPSGTLQITGVAFPLVFDPATGILSCPRCVTVDGSGNVTIGGSLTTGAATSAPGQITIPAAKSNSGTRFVCVDTSGIFQSSATPCSGN